LVVIEVVIAADNTIVAEVVVLADKVLMVVTNQTVV
jgi:hypothetical protein